MVDHPPNTQSPLDRSRTPDGLIFDTPIETPTRQITFMTRKPFETRGRSMTRDAACLIAESITIDDTETPSSLNYATLFKILKDLLDDEIKSAMKVQYTAVQHMLSQKIEDTINRKIKTLDNIMP